MKSIKYFRILILFIAISSMLSCKSEINENKPERKKTRPSKIESTKPEKDKIKEDQVYISLDSSSINKLANLKNELIPNDLLKALMSKNYRLPELKDYPKNPWVIGMYPIEEMIKEFLENEKLPYATKGLFNKDSLIDFTLVLIKRDSQFVSTFHTTKTGYHQINIEAEKLSSYGDSLNNRINYFIDMNLKSVIVTPFDTIEADNDIIEVDNMYKGIGKSYVSFIDSCSSELMYEEILYD